MAAVMYKAASVEDSTVNESAEKVAQLEYENKHLRELLQFSPRLVEGEGSVFLSSEDGGSSRTLTEKSNETIIR